MCVCVCVCMFIFLDNILQIFYIFRKILIDFIKMNETDEFEDFDDPMSEIHVKVIFTIIFLLVFIVAFFGNILLPCLFN